MRRRGDDDGAPPIVARARSAAYVPYSPEQAIVHATQRDWLEALEIKEEQANVHEQLEAVQKQLKALQRSHVALLEKVLAQDVPPSEGLSQATLQHQRTRAKKSFTRPFSRPKPKAVAATRQSKEPTPEKASSRGRLRRLARLVRRPSEIGLRGEAANTGTLHMWAVAQAIDPHASRLKAWLAMCASLSLVIIQIFAFTWVNYDASSPTCSAHTECRAGEFCAFSPARSLGVDFFLGITRCTDCASATDWTVGAGVQCNVSNVLGTGDFGSEAFSPWSDELRVWDDLDHSIEWLTDHVRVARGMHRFGWLTAEGRAARWNATERAAIAEEYTKFACRAAWHCEETDRWADECDHIKLNHANLHTSQICLLGFVALLLSVPLAEDMEEAAIEEALLKYGVREGVDAPRSSLDFILRALLLVALRLRRFFVPWACALAGVAVLVASPLSATNILLNVLAVAFVTEADDMLSAMFLPPAAHRQADDLLEGLIVDDSWFSVRLLASLCVFTMAVYVATVATVVDAAYAFIRTTDQGLAEAGPCYMLQPFLNSWTIALPILGVVLNGVGSFWAAPSRSFCRKAASAVATDAANFAIMGFGSLCNFRAGRFITNDELFGPLLAVGTIVFGLISLVFHSATTCWWPETRDSQA